MADIITNRDYSEIERPYDSFLYRSEPNDTNGSVMNMPVKSDGDIGDVWIKNFIRSENWKPKTSGFYIDGQTGYAEFMNVFVSGDIQALTGTIGGFDIGSDYLRDTANSFGLASTVSGGDDVRFWAGDTFANRATADFRVTEAGVVTAANITITGGDISGTPISGIPNNSSTDISLLEKNHDIVFSVTDADTIEWSTGTINLSNGRTFSIVAGNTGNMTLLTYIYLDPAISETILQTTTTYSIAIGANKVLLGTAQNNTVTASFIPYGPGQPLIDGANIGALSIVAGNIAASTITAGKMSVSDLSAISANIGTITSGSISVVNGANTIGFTPAGANAIFSGPTGSPTFRVTPAGALTATGVTITGAINATSGTFSGTITASGTISGGAITGATITGSTLTTASSGARIVLESTLGRFYDSTGTEIITMAAVANTFILAGSQTGSALDFRHGASGNIRFTGISGKTLLYDGTNGRLLPFNTTMDLGASGAGNGFENIYVDSINVGGGINAVTFEDVLRHKQSTSDPSSGQANTDGAMYYNTSSGELRLKKAGSWVSVTTS